jgi:diadenosine tetraphosphate (Ap4A) HIT family hydrolase
MYYHYRKTRKKYASFPPATDCQFCDPHKHAAAIHQETPHAYVIANRTFYDQWELRKVTDHRMIIPKRHVHTLSELSAEERVDIIDIIADYESRGYEVYARAPTSTTRSVQHQHTHLIKAEPKTARGLFFLHKPYILWLFR